jgi:ferredoxin
MKSEMIVLVRINPIRCRGHAICALLFSEGIELDRWGYGRVAEATAKDRRSIRRAYRAAAACPNGAVEVVQLESTGAQQPPLKPPLRIVHEQ